MKSIRYASIVCFLLSVFVGYQISFAQSYPWAEGTWEQQLSKQIGIPGTFESLSAKKVEVGATGDFSLDIPLLRIPSHGNLAFDLIASYAPGISVNQEASWIGLGWNIPLGAITRNILARVDRKPDSVMSGDWEGYRDFYTITCPAGNGTMLQFPSGTPGEYVFELEEERSWKIIFDSNAGRFIVVVEDGTTYVFGFVIIGASSNVYREYGEVGLQAGDQPPGMQWLLTAILSTDYVDGGNDPYNPIDSPQPALDNSGGWLALTYSYDPVGMPNDMKKWFFYQRVPYAPDWVAKDINLIEVSYPWRIVSPMFVAEFVTEQEERNIVSEEMDMTWGSNPNGPYFTPDSADSGGEKKRRLASVSLYPYSGSGTSPIQNKLISRVEFEYLTSGQISPRTMLFEIKFKTATDSIPSYKFEYNAQNGPAPDYDSMQDQTGLLEPAYDGRLGFNGWYNGHPEWHGQTTGAQGLSTDGEAWNLKKIIYPTGGSNEFYYEADRYCNLGDCSSEGSWYWGRGVRLASQVVKDGTGSTQSYAYSYSSFALNGAEVIGKGVLYNNPLWYFRIFHSSDVPNSNAGFRTAVTNQLSATRPVMYEKVVETNSLIGSVASYYAVRKYDDYWLTFQASTDSEVIYDRTLKNRGYLKRREYSNTSGTLQRKEEFHRAEEILQTHSVSAKPLYMSVVKTKDSVATFQYDQNGQNPVTTTTQYFYENPAHSLLTKTIETNSDGTIRTTRMKYPLDYGVTSPSSGDAMVRALDSMKTVRHILNPVIERMVTEQRSGGSEMLASAQLTKYKGFATSQLLPSDQLILRDTLLAYASFTQSSSSTSAFTYDSRYFAKQKFELFDPDGNLLQSKDAYDTPTAYKWALNSTVPVAVFSNATNAQTFFDEFADGDSVGWAITDVGSDGDTKWEVDGGKLIQTNYASAADGECDRITYDLGTEITGDVVLEFDLTTANPNYWDLTIAMGGDQWNGGNGGTENAVWTAFIDNTAWYVYNTTWSVIQSGFTVGSTHHIKIVAKCSAGKADYYVDGKRVRTDVNFRYSTSGIRKVSFGNYGYSSNTSVWYIDNVRLYPYATVAKTASYNPVTLLTEEMHDENGVTTRYKYDAFQRLVETQDNSGRVISAQNYYYSRSLNGDTLNSSDPNFTETAAFPEGAPTDGLVGHWRLEGNGIDETGNNNLNLVGDAVSRGYLGTTKSFDGTKTKYAHAPLISAYQTQRPTMTAWVKLASTTTSWTIADMNVKGAWQDGRGCYLATNTSGKVSFIVGNASGSWKVVTGATSLQANTWYHVAGTYDGTYLRIYINGVEDGANNVGSITLSFTPIVNRGPNPSTFYIGIQHNANESDPTYDPHLAYPFNGSIDDIRIYNRSLSAAEIKSLANPNVTTAYVDGLGRGIQTQTRLGNDNIVTGKKYDALGRDWKTFKPYQISLGANAHKYTANDSSNSNTYYAGLDNDEADTGGYPYSELEYFPDPLNRIKRQAAPGSAFRMGTGKEVKLEYWSNSGSEVSGYNANTLFKTRRKDEDDKIVDTFTDKFGNTVASITDSAGLNLKTTFEYNVLGSITKSTPPKGSTWATTYKFNTLQQMREKTSPDAGTAKYLYDKNGNARLAKDANHTGSTNSVSISGNLPYLGSANGSFTMALPGKLTIAMTRPGTCDPGSYVQTKIKAADGTVLGTFWTDQLSYSNSIILPKGSYLYEVTTDIQYCTSGYPTYSITANQGYELVYQKYDVFNRVTEIGEYESNSTGSLTQTNADNSSYPTSGQIIRNKFTYDDPSSDPLAAGQRNLKGRVSVAESYRLSTLALTTFYSYDELGRVEWVIHKGLGSYSKKVIYTYDLQGRVTKKEYNDAQSASYNLFTYYEFDQTGRLTKVSTNTTDNPGTATTEAQYTYYASTTKRLQLANAQGVDYRYNARDWLKQINHQNLSSAYDPGGDGGVGSSTAEDRFAQIIGYNTAALIGYDPDFTWQTRYNGNISWMITRTRNVGLQGINAGYPDPNIGYVFTYDNAQRLTKADFGYHHNVNGWINNTMYDEQDITYDGNGNILTLRRYGVNVTVMDSLTYSYSTNTNKLSYINDAVSAGVYSVDIDDQSAGNYTYDANGNMQKDAQKSIGFIISDINNQPVAVYKTDGTLYKYYYDTQGNRVRKDEGTTEYYVQGANGSTDAVVKSDGSQATHNISGTVTIGQVKRNSTTWSRFYYLTDHLGSVRVIVNSSGAVDTYNDFYPFGMTMEQRSGSSNADARYKYTSKERDVQTGYDYFGARYYDARIGRWLVADPLAEKYPDISPYTYGHNNPINRIDIDGRQDPRIVQLKILAMFKTQTGSGYYRASKGVREHGFAIRNPIAAYRIGQVSRGSDNISTSATRFSMRGPALGGPILNVGTDNEGGQTNAFRHALWQATIASELGESIAAQAGNAHEENPFADLTQRAFASLSEADQTVDLLNNIIGREIGGQNPASSMKELASKALGVFAKQGLWTATKNKDGTYSISRTQISDEQYQKLMEIFQQLDDAGRRPGER